MVSQLVEVADQTFDYVVIGGGTAGLTVAGRLVEDPSVTVAVLEAGEANLDDPNILLCGQFGATWGNPKYDWYNMTAPQKYANNRRCQWSSGKGLGGSSAMNFCTWSKPHAADVDAWEKLGNPGWNWKLFQKYALKVEQFTDASEEQLIEIGHFPGNSMSCGSIGPVKTTVPWTHAKVDKLFQDALGNMGIQDAQDPLGGDIVGKSLFSNNLDRTNKWTRSYAATGYYLPSKDKPNYKVLTEAYGSRIIFSDRMDGEDIVATGVEFAHKGRKYVVHARKEVVVSAGTVTSPAILERSGIGRKEVLDRIGVPARVALPGVGENVQDHVYAIVSYELKHDAGFTSFDMLRDPEFAAEQARLHELDQKNTYRRGITGVSYSPLKTLFPDYADVYYEQISTYVADIEKSGALPPGRKEQYQLQLEMLKDEKLPDLELVAVPAFMAFVTSQPEPGKLYLSVMVVLQHPFSRGTIHAASNDPLEPPVIDPRTFENPYDIELMVKGVQYVRRMAETEPFKSGIPRETDPGPDQTSDEQLKEYIRNTVSTVHHPVGSLSMLPREKNGCIDTELKVYGTKNVRVADASIIPLEISGHTQCAAYTIGEIAADILKNGHPDML